MYGLRLAPSLGQAVETLALVLVVPLARHHMPYNNHACQSHCIHQRILRKNHTLQKAVAD